jgi:hypothetical protein
VKKNPKKNRTGKSGSGLGILVFAACVLALSGCGRAKAQAKYDGGADKKQNSAGTLSVTLPPAPTADVQTNGATIHKLGDVSPFKTGNIVEIKEKMFIAQTHDVYLHAEDYMGKTIKLEGLFKTQSGYDEQTNYCFVLRYGPGCCGFDGNAGFEVAWDAPSEAAPYPGEDDWVEAVGVLKTYEEDGYPYLYLALSSLQVLDQRGAEFVSQ